jgi:superfamily II DNA or RNA helicase
MHGRVPEPGAWVWIRQQPWRVERARVDRNVVRLDVAHGGRSLTFLSPFDRPACVERRRTPVRARRGHAVARASRALGDTCSWDTPMAARDARVDVLPHQLEPVLAVLSGCRRLLIADAVGLGKTIQAGLVLAELHRRHLSLRALVIVPAPLVDQWTGELRERFGLTTSVADRDTLATAAATVPFGETPWSRPGIWITSADFLKQPHVFDAVPLTAWDLLVIDEAHGVVGASDRHTTCDELARRARHVILLTATPHSGDTARFERLIRLGALPGAHGELVVFRRTAAEAGMARRRVVRWHRIPVSRDAARVLEALAGFERVVLRRARPEARDQATLLLAVFRKRAVSTLHALDRSLGRRLAWLQSPGRTYLFDWLQPHLTFDADDTVAEDERGALIADSGLAPMEERTWLRRLRALTAAARRHDSKVARLSGLLARRREPVVIFTEYRDSLECLHDHLGRTHAVATIHGGLDPAARRDALRRFLDGRARVLIATDVGGQGLNLQSRARWVINLELPWNPVRLEQRIGRVDRIGQSRAVHATVFVARHRAEETILLRLGQKALTAARAAGIHALEAFAPPSARAVADALMTDTPLPAAAPPAPGLIMPCRAWARRARAHARALIIRRHLQARWRGPHTGTPRPRWVRVWRRADAPCGRVAVLTLVSTSIVDGTGAVIERRSIALRFTATGHDRHLDRAARAAIDAAIAQHLAARVRRVRRLLAAAAVARLETERAIARHLRDQRSPELTQLGLFSRAEHQRSDEDRQRAAAVTRGSAAAARAAQAGVALRIGRADVEVVWSHG